MRVSAKSDYALRALIELAVRPDGAPVSAEELGRLQGIPAGFLQAILADLRRAEIVLSQRGQSGGWRLAREAGAVTVADELELEPMVHAREHVDAGLVAGPSHVAEHRAGAGRAVRGFVPHQVHSEPHPGNLAHGAGPRGQCGCQASSSLVRAATARGSRRSASDWIVTCSHTSRRLLRAAIQTCWSTSADSL